MFGNLLTLLLAQSRGWPFIALFWGLADFGLLHGGSKFASHWLFWQDAIDIFNVANPGYAIYCHSFSFRRLRRVCSHEFLPFAVPCFSYSGSVTSNIWNTRLLLIAVTVGIVVSIKRLWLGLFLGKKTFGKPLEAGRLGVLRFCRARALTLTILSSIAIRKPIMPRI